MAFFGKRKEKRKFTTQQNPLFKRRNAARFHSGKRQNHSRPLNRHQSPLPAPARHRDQACALSGFAALHRQPPV